MLKKLIFIIPLVVAYATVAPASTTFALEEINETITTSIDEPTAATTQIPPLGETDEVAGTTDSSETESSSSPDNTTGCDTPNCSLLDTLDWPVILSFSAIILAVLIILIINLITHRKAKEIQDESKA